MPFVFTKVSMVSSTEIPKAILKIRIVEGLIGIPMNPISQAVISKGNKLGIREIITVSYTHLTLPTILLV